MLTLALLRNSCALVLLLLLSTARQSLSQDSTANENHANTIRGTVINAVTQSPVSRALVYSGDNQFAALTDSDGHFEFTVHNAEPASAGAFVFGGPQASYRRGPGQFWLMARKPGFLGQNGGPQATVSPGDEITIPLIPEAILKGKISVESGEPAAGVFVQLFSREIVDGIYRWVHGLATQTNSQGEFRFAELPAGSYKVVTHEWMDNDPVAATPGAQVFGFPPVYYPGVSDYSAASTIELSAGQTLEADLAITRQPYFQVRIPVPEPALGGMDIHVQGQRGPGYALGYNEAEQRIEGLLPNGNYTVQAITYGMNSSSGTVNIRVAGGTVDGPALRLAPNSSIALQVKEEFNDTQWSGSMTWNDGKRTITLHGPRTYLQVQAISADDSTEPRGGSLRPPAAPNDNSLQLENLSPGKYWLQLSTARGYIASAMMGSTDLLRQPFVVGSGPSAPIEVTLRDDGAEIDGTVTSSGDQDSGSRPRQAFVYCLPLPESSGQYMQLGVSDDGKFSNPMMAPGDYRVLAFANQQPHLPYRDPEAMKAFDGKGTVVHLAAGQKTSVQVQVIPESEQ
jgi:hypothetical protein